MRARLVATAVVAAFGGVAHADERLDLQLPDVQLFEPAYHLDRGVPYDDRKKSGHTDQLSIGGARADDGGTYDALTGRTGGDARPAFVGSAALGLGRQEEAMIALWRSELYGLSGRGVRGRHRGLLELRTKYDDDIGVDGTLIGDAEHGDARGLAPVRKGPGERVTGDLDLEVMVRLGKKKSDMRLVAVAGGGFGGTAWEATHAPTLDTENHNSAMIAVAAAPADGELPRGRFDIVRLDVESQRIHLRPTAMPVDPSMPIGPGNGGVETRNIDVLVGAKDMTLYIDHESFAIIDSYIGGSWVETESAAGTIHDSALNMRMATSVKWRPDSDDVTRSVGFNFSRTPTTTPDGQRIVGEWRFEVASGVETENYTLGARGGVSWLEPLAGGPTEVKTLVRYGMELEAFAKIAMGIEAGIYHANSYEPRETGDPWATPRRWSVESGALVRLRH